MRVLRDLPLTVAANLKLHTFGIWSGGGTFCVQAINSNRVTRVDTYIIRPFRLTSPIQGVPVR